MTLKYLYYSIAIIFTAGLILIGEAKAESRHDPVTNVYNSVSYGHSTCAVAGAAGLHQYQVSPKLQGSFSAANCDSVNAISFGVGAYHQGFLWSITGSVDDKQDESKFIGGQIGFTFT